jgi:cell division protein FtsQ
VIGGGRGQSALRRRGGPTVIRRRARRARGARLRSPVRLPRPGPLALLAIAAVVALLVGGWVWVRDSSLVAVQRVTVAGVSGPDASEIRSALILAARAMTTLDVKMGDLRSAVEPFPVVKNLQVSTQFPHGMRIRVVEQVPVAVVAAGGARTAVSGDGTLLRDVIASSSLPTIALDVAPGGTRLTGPTLSEVRLLAAAPYELLAKVSEVSSDGANGLVAQLRDGPKIYFGDASQLALKWTAATEVLAGSAAVGAAYVDVTVPERPAAGGGLDKATAIAAGSSSGQTATTATSPGG